MIKMQWGMPLNPRKLYSVLLFKQILAIKLRLSIVSFSMIAKHVKLEHHSKSTNCQLNLIFEGYTSTSQSFKCMFCYDKVMDFPFYYSFHNIFHVKICFV